MSKVISWFGFVAVGVLLFSIGFWFGFKYEKPTQGTAGEVNVVAQQKNITALDIPGTYWIKSGEKPVCPENYDIKGKYDGTTGYYYMRDNKNYDKTRPLVCFATEDVAKNVAGFIRKY